MSSEDWTPVEFDLNVLVERARVKFSLESIYLFGSRRFKTKSLRSDIDIFFEVQTQISQHELRKFIDENCVALDIFTIDRGVATSRRLLRSTMGCASIKFWRVQPRDIRGP